MRKGTTSVCLVLAVAVLALSKPLSAQITKYQQDQWLNSPAVTSHIGNLTGHAKDAVMDYHRYCVTCHGELGNGKGPSARWFQPPLYPKPRDFQLAIFKCRSTPTGTLPTDEDLFNTITRGLDRSAMPSWRTLGRQERANLVAYIKHFSPRWQTEKAGTPIQIPPEPQVTPEQVKAGQEVYAKVGCWKCHGVTGRANGPSASTLTDDLGRPILPYNFASGARPMCGGTDKDLYRIFMTGLDGTPMPSFANVIKPDEAWNLIFFLRTLQPPNAYNGREKKIAKEIDLKPLNAMKLSQQ